MNGDGSHGHPSGQTGPERGRSSVQFREQGIERCNGGQGGDGESPEEPVVAEPDEDAVAGEGDCTRDEEDSEQDDGPLRLIDNGRVGGEEALPEKSVGLSTADMLKP